MRAVIVLVAMLVLSSQLIADCPMLPSPCGELARSTVVFYGEVRAARFVNRAVGPGEVSREQDVEFNVLEAWKGVNRGAFSATFELNSESTTFEAGKRFLVYAYRRDGRLSTGCSRTTRALTASEKGVPGEPSAASALVIGELTTLRDCR